MISKNSNVSFPGHVFFVWRRDFARNVEILWDQSRQLPTFKIFTDTAWFAEREPSPNVFLHHLKIFYLSISSVENASKSRVRLQVLQKHTHFREKDGIFLGHTIFLTIRGNHHSSLITPYAVFHRGSCLSL